MKIIDSIFKEKKENRLDFRHQYQTIFKFVDDGVAVLDKEDIPTISELQQKKAHLRVIDLTDAALQSHTAPLPADNEPLPGIGSIADGYGNTEEHQPGWQRLLP